MLEEQRETPLTRGDACLACRIRKVVRRVTPSPARTRSSTYRLPHRDVMEYDHAVVVANASTKSANISESRLVEE